MNQAKLQSRKHVELKGFIGVRSRLEVGFFCLLDQRVNNIRLSPLGDLATNICVGLGTISLPDDPRAYGRPAWGHLVNDRQGQVSEYRQRKGAGYRCGGHHQNVGRSPLPLQGRALADTEAMLFVDDPQPESREADPLLEYGMGADQQMDVTLLQKFVHFFFFRQRHRSGKEPRMKPELFEPESELFIVLFSEYLSRRYDGDLVVVFDRYQGGHQGDDRFAAADIPLNQPVHRSRSEHVVLDLAKHPPLRFGQGVWEHFRQRSGVEVFEFKGYPRLGLPPSPAQRHSQLEVEKLLENQGLARWIAGSLEGLQG